MSQENKNNSPLDANRLIAAVGTLIVALLLLMAMLLVHLDIAEPASSDPENENITMEAIEPDDIPDFIEPVLLENAGELDATQDNDPAPVPDGTPDEADKPQNSRVVNSNNPKENTSSEKLVTTTRPSEKKTAEPSQKDKPDSRIADNMKSQFSPHNGRAGGESAPTATTGAGGKGTGATGTLKGGRKLLSCPMPTVSLRQKEVIKVEVYVDAQGHVTEANVISGSADATLREKCRRASLKATWTPKADAPRTRGVITWTLVPKY